MVLLRREGWSVSAKRMYPRCGTPRSITVDNNGSEFASRVMEGWSYRQGTQLDCIRPGEPVDNGFIERVNGQLRDECLNVEGSFTLEDVREKSARWREDYNRLRPHSSLQDERSVAFARIAISAASPDHAQAESSGLDRVTVTGRVTTEL